MRMLRFLSRTLSATMLVTVAFAQQPEAPTAPAAPERPKSAKQKDRVFVKDIEGLWLTRDYMDALRVTRQPHVASRKALPVLIKIQKEGRSYPIMRTDFSRAVLQRVLDIEPMGKPGSYRLAVADEDMRAVPAEEVTYIPFRGEKGTEGRFDSLMFAEPTFAKGRFRDYFRIQDSLVVFVNRAVLAGRYVDEQGRVYEFSEAGEATFPDTKFEYEVSLAAEGATCDYFDTADDKAPGGRKRYGFAWKGDKLQLFNAAGAEPKKVRCDKKPFAVLKLQG
jgi:hypothetical protein